MQQEHRKLAAIMFTDIAGYTSLMAKDEHLALEILRKNRDIIKTFVSQFNGEWLKEMGDGTLSSFGSVVDAVNCAIEIQNALRDEPDFRLRIGIHIGDVVVEEGDVFGDGVNVASRIEKLAEPGGICVSGRVYEDIQNKPMIEASYLGEKTLKNVTSPVKIYALKREGSLPSSGVPATSNIPPERTIPSIVVLPFLDMSPEKDQDYFCEGMAEEIINGLTHVENLHVVARTSAFSFKGKDVDIGEIGSRLKVAHVLEGSIRKAGNRLRITAQLIKVEDGFHLWSERFDRELDDVFAIQDEMSLAIVEVLKVKLLVEEKRAITMHYTNNLEAYNQYLLGYHHLSTVTPEGLTRGIDYLQKAIEKDPFFARAHVAMADGYLLLGVYGYMDHQPIFPKAKEAVSMALEIDDSLSEAHGTSGWLNLHIFDFKGAETELTKALILNPKNVYAHIYYGCFFSAMEKHDDAVIELKKALELDPLSLLVNYILGMLLFLADRCDDAINQLLHTLDLGLFPNAYLWLGGSYLFSGNHKKAIEAYNMYVTLTGKNPASLGYLGYAYCITGQKDKALEILNKLDELPKPDYDPTYGKALISAGMGEIDRTFIYLEDLVQKKNTTIVWIKVLPQFDILHADPRYKALCRKMGFPE